MKTRIATALESLNGLALQRSGCAAGMVSFLFNHPGGAPDAEASLHVQCPWRIVEHETIAVASTDVFLPADEDLGPALFDPETDTSLFERRMTDWLGAQEPGALAVSGVLTDALGGFLMRFSGGATLEVFPAHSLRTDNSEHWRLLRPGGKPHFVVGGDGDSEI
jgi:hypothetical protein